MFVATTPEEALPIIRSIDVLFGWKVPEVVLEAGVNLRWFQSMGAGVDDVIPHALHLNDVRVTRVVDQFGVAISEFVFAHLLYHVKSLKRTMSAQRSHRWEGFTTETLAGKMLGVAGLGSIGRVITKTARTFGMNVSGLSLHAAKHDDLDLHFLPTDWAMFAAQVDYLVLTLPLTEKTRHVIDETLLGCMKSTAWLVNVGRGGLVDTAALVRWLQQNRLGGAVLDVFEEEPLSSENVLWDLPNVYITPHISGPSQTDDVANFFIENLARYESSGSLRGVVNLQLGY